MSENQKGDFFQTHTVDEKDKANTHW